MEATIPYGKAVTVKSVEQRMIEKAAYEFASKMKAVLGKDTTVRINIDNAPLSKIAEIADKMRDDEGQKPLVSQVDFFGRKKKVLYLHWDTAIKGEGFEIESIGE